MHDWEGVIGVDIWGDGNGLIFDLVLLSIVGQVHTHKVTNYL